MESWLIYVVLGLLAIVAQVFFFLRLRKMASNQHLASHLAELVAHHHREASETALYEKLLEQLLPLTHSRWGMVLTENGNSDMHIASFLDTTGHQSLESIRARGYCAKGSLGVRVFEQGVYIVANHPSLDPRNKLTSAHFERFLGLPLVHDHRVQAVIVLADSNQNYSALQAHTLAPLLETSSELIAQRATRVRAEHAELQLQSAMQLLELNQDAALILSGRAISYANQKAQTLFERKLDELVGKSLEKLSAQWQLGDRQASAALPYYYQEALAGHPQKFYWVLDSNQRERTVEVRIQAVKTEGHTEQVIMLMRDMTHAKDTLEDARENEPEMQELRSGVWEWSLLTGRVHVNDGLAKALGYAPHELKDIDLNYWKKQYHPDDLAKYETAFEKHRLWLSDQAACTLRIFSKRGQWLRFYQVLRIADRTRTDEPLNVAASLFLLKDQNREVVPKSTLGHDKRIAEWCDDIICTLSLRGQIVYANSAMLKKLGYSSHRLLMTSFYDYMNDDLSNNIRQTLHEARETGRYLKTTCVIKTVDGEALTVSWDIFFNAEEQCWTLMGRAKAATQINADTQLLKLIAEGTHECFAVLNRETEVIYTSRPFDALVGSKADCAHRQLEELIPMQGKTHLSASISEQVTKVGGFSDSVAIKLPNQKTKYYQLMIQPLGQDGQYYYALLRSMPSITALNSEVDIDNAVMANLDIGQWSYRYSDKQLLLSQAAQKILGFDEQAAETARGLFDLFLQPEDRLRFNKIISDHQASGATWQALFLAKNTFKQPLWILFTGRSIGSEGKPNHIVGTLQDVSSQMQHSEAVATAANHTDALAALSFAPEVNEGTLDIALPKILLNCCETLNVKEASYWQFNTFGDQLECTLRYEQNVGPLKSSRVLQKARYGRLFDKLYTQNTLKLDEGSGDIHLKSMAGYQQGDHDIESVMVYMVIGGGTFNGMLLIADNQLHRLWNRREEDYLKSVCAIINSVIERSHREENELRLIKAIDDSQQASIAKSQFLATMSHEIRTPMNGILGMLDIVLKGELDNEQSDKLKKAKSCADSLLLIINDILDYSKIEAGKMSLEHKDFSLSQVIDEVVHGVDPLLHKQSNQLIVNVTSLNVDHVKGDETRIKQILFNLLGNAIKFTKNGAITLSCATVADDDNDLVNLTCSVRDTGIGIAQDKLEALFDAFTQVDASSSCEFGGTGLGLSITRDLVQLMGGQVNVESALGKGSCFTFTAIFHSADSRQPTIEKSKNYYDKHAFKTALLVEDNEMNWEIAQFVLSDLGLDITIARDGQEAIEILKTRGQQFDIVFMDCQMPGRDGYDITRAIRDGEAGEENKSKLIVAMTANAMKGDREICLSSGMDDYLKKPLEENDIQHILAKWSQKDDPRMLH